MMNKSITNIEHIKVLPVNRYHKSDSIPFSVFDVNKASLKDLVSKFKITTAAAKAVISARKKKKQYWCFI